MNRDRDTERSKQKLISMGKQKGYVTYDEVNDAMPDDIVSSDQIDDWLSTLGDEGIEVVDPGHGPRNAVKVPSTRVAKVAEPIDGADAEDAEDTIDETVEPAEHDKEEKDL